MPDQRSRRDVAKAREQRGGGGSRPPASPAKAAWPRTAATPQKPSATAIALRAFSLSSVLVRCASTIATSGPTPISSAVVEEGMRDWAQEIRKKGISTFRNASSRMNAISRLLRGQTQPR